MRFAPKYVKLAARSTRFPPERGGIFFRLILFLVMIGALVALGWMLFLPVLLTQRIRARTGFDATIAQLAVNPFAGTIEAKEFVLANPPTFPVGEFLELKHFQADADSFSLFSDVTVFNSMEVEIGNLTLVKRSDGVSNGRAFERNFAESGAGGPRPPSTAAPRRYLVKKLRLRIARVTTVDHSGREPQVRVYPVNIDQRYIDVTSLRQLLEPKALQGLEPVAVAIADLLPADLHRVFDETVKSGATFLKDGARTTSNKVKGFFDALEESKKP